MAQSTSASSSATTESSEPKPSLAVAAWGVLGFSALLVSAVYRLAPKAIAPIRAGTLSHVQVGIYVIWVAWMWYFEGYRAFQKQLCPRFVARAMHLARTRRPLHVALAPLFCMAYFHATRRRMMTSWLVSLGVIGLIVGVHFVKQPWRGIIDGGVVVGLSYGLAWLLVLFARAVRGVESHASPELPGSVV